MAAGWHLLGGAGWVFACLRLLWRHGSVIGRVGAGGELAYGVFAGVAGDGVVVDQVGACPAEEKAYQETRTRLHGDVLWAEH